MRGLGIVTVPEVGIGTSLLKELLLLTME